MKQILSLILLCSAMVFAQAAATAEAAPAASGPRTPLFVGGSISFASGTTVGSEYGVGIRSVQPLVGVWLPNTGFLRIGYGFFDYLEKPDNGESIEVDHSEFDIELGVNLLGSLYLTGSYSRAKDLSDVGDVSWNEWGVGFGTFLQMFGKSVLFAELSYHNVGEYYNPFLEKNIDGSRIQLNLGFFVYVY